MDDENQKPEWALRIGQLRQRLQMSQAAFAETLHVGQGNVSKWEKGLNKPLPAVLSRIAMMADSDDKEARNFFLEEAGLSKSYYRQVDTVVAEYMKNPVPELQANRRNTRPINVFGHAGAGPFLFIEENKLWEIELPKVWFTGMGEIAGVVVTGDSMQPIIDSGCIVLIDRARCTPAACLDRIVAVSDGDGVAVKWLRKSSGGYLLVPNNQSIDNQILAVNSHHRILGCAVRWIAQAAYTVIAEGERNRI